MTAKEVLAKWDAGEPVQSVSMGGMGGGYEQPIQVCIFEIVRDHLARPIPLLKPRDGGYPDMTDEQRSDWELWRDQANKACLRAEKEFDLGLSGAQAGAAINAASNLLAYPKWEDALATLPPAREITVRKAIVALKEAE